MMATMDDMRVWVGCLACYNDGRLVGEWVDAVDAADHVPCERAGHEEWWCFDTEGLPGLGECSPSEAAQYAGAVTGCVEGTDAPYAAVFAYLDNFHGGPADTSALDSFEDAWCGEWDSEEDWAADLAESCGYVEGLGDGPLAHYIDWSRWAHDLFLGDYWSSLSPNGGVFVFRSM